MTPRDLPRDLPRDAARDRSLARPRGMPPWLRVLLVWIAALALCTVLGAACLLVVRATAGGEPIVWRTPRALWLLVAAPLVGVFAFHVQRRRTATLAYSTVALAGARGAASLLGYVPGVLRVAALAALAVALARPETYRTVEHEVDTIDIMIVVDMSKSMEETDLPRDRLDAAQRVIRRFLRRTQNDRVGLVVFGQEAMLQCPLTQDTEVVERIVSNLQIGDVAEMGTAIGDGLGLALAQLRRSDARSKVVILLSDGDSNWVTRFEPAEAAHAAKDLGVKVYTLLVGREDGGGFDSMPVDPETLRNIASITNGEFFRASDYESFDRGFQTVRNKLDTTKRVVKERVPDRQLFGIFALLAALLVALDYALVHTRLRRVP